MAGYTRSYSKSTGNTIEASDFNVEFQLIDDAFNESTGHVHDGSTDNGAYVPIVSDSDNKNSVELDSTNNEIDFNLEVGAVKTRQMVLTDGALLPDTNNDLDFGSGTYKVKNVYIAGNITVDGTVDGRDVAADGTKLDGVEASADATDATNVAAAGAVMDGDFSSNGLMKRTGAGTYAVAAAPTGTVVGTTDIQTLTNKTINDASNSFTITAATVDNVASGNLIATDVQGALNEIQTEIDGLIVTGGEPTTYEVLDGKGDVGTGAAQVAQGSHLHAGTYEPADATIIKQADVDDVAVNGVTTAPISSNWAFDHAAATNTHGVSGVIVGTTSSQTLTTKTIDLGNNTITGTFAEFNTAVQDATLVSTSGTETLSNKTFSDGFSTGGATNLAVESGGVTISTGDSTVITASTSADDLVIENNAGAGVSVLTPNTEWNYLRFGDPQDSGAGGLSYHHGTSPNPLRFRSDGSVSMSMTTAGLEILAGGIKLDNLGSSNVNTLDDYEEGTFTPTVQFETAGDSSPTYTTQKGNYVKIGRMVHVQIYLNVSITHTTASGDFEVSSLPFTSHSDSLARHSICVARFTNLSNWLDSGGTNILTQLQGTLYPSSTDIKFQLLGSLGNVELKETHIPSGSGMVIQLSGTYMVD